MSFCSNDRSLELNTTVLVLNIFTIYPFNNSIETARRLVLTSSLNLIKFFCICFYQPRDLRYFSITLNTFIWKSKRLAKKQEEILTYWIKNRAARGRGFKLRYAWRWIYRQILFEIFYMEQASLLFHFAMNPKQDWGGGVWRPSPLYFFCPCTLIFNTIPRETLWLLMKRNLKDFS